MPMMTGDAYRKSLLDGRRCYIDGELIADPSQHPMLKTAVDSVSATYDRFYRDDPDAFHPMYLIPKSREDLDARMGGGMHRQRMLALDSFDLAPVKARARAAAGIVS